MAFEALGEKWGKPYPAIPKLWRAAWGQFIPFLDYDVELRRVLCSANAIESLNARYRRAITVKGHFPTERAALKVLYLVTRSLDPKGTGQARWITRWKPALNAFAITFADRMLAAENHYPNVHLHRSSDPFLALTFSDRPVKPAPARCHHLPDYTKKRIGLVPEPAGDLAGLWSRLRLRVREPIDTRVMPR